MSDLWLILMLKSLSEATGLAFWQMSVVFCLFELLLVAVVVYLILKRFN